MSEGLLDAPNQQVVRPDGSGPADEGQGGSTQKKGGRQSEKQEKQEEKLPAQHAGLDELAAARGVTWSRDDLTVAEKQAELGG